MQASFDALIAASERVCWTLDEVMPKGGKLDFTEPFLPEALVFAEAATSLSSAERLKLKKRWLIGRK